MGILGILAVATIAALMYFYYPFAGVPGTSSPTSIDQDAIQKAQNIKEALQARDAQSLND